MNMILYLENRSCYGHVYGTRGELVRAGRKVSHRATNRRVDRASKPQPDEIRVWARLCS
jgi:hypothetical protein